MGGRGFFGGHKRSVSFSEVLYDIRVAFNTQKHDIISFEINQHRLGSGNVFYF